MNTYDTKGRQLRSALWQGSTEYSWTRNVYGTDHNWWQSFTTVNSTNEETWVLHLLDGASRERLTLSEHPGSTGGLRLSYKVFDIVGRVSEWSNPTEIDGYWAPAGDDASGYKYSTQAFDWKGRPTVTTNQDNTTRSISYEGCGCAGSDVTEITDEVGRKQKVYRDVFGRTTKTEVMNGSAVYSSTATDYNVRDQVTTVTEYAGTAGSGGASQQTLMTFDGYARLLTRKRPQETSPTTYSYYDDDRLLSSIDARGATGTIIYNARGLMTQVSYSVPSGVAATPTVTFQYNQNGQRTLMDDGPGAVTYEYDSLSRLFKETRSFAALSGQTFPLNYEYNASGQLTKITDPTNSYISYAHDKVGRVTAITGSPYAGVTDYATGIAYRAFDASRSASYGSGFSASASYTARMLVDEFDIPGVIGGKYTWNAAGQVSTFKAETPQSNQYDRRMDRSFTYDATGRINGTQAGYTAGLGGDSIPYAYSPQYDEFNNVTGSSYLYWQSGNTAVSFSASYQNNKATGVTDAQQAQTWNYDAMGNRTSIVRNGITLETIQIDAVGRAQNGAFDGEGRDVSPDAYSGYYLRSSVLGGAVVTELDHQGNKLKGRVLDGGQLIAEQLAQENKVQWHHRDPLNLVARDTEPGQVKRRTFLINPVGAQIETTEGVDLGQYYTCLYGAPNCNSGYHPQPPGGYGYHADQANGTFAAGFKVDGALTLLSPAEAAAQAGRTGNGSDYVSPGIWGTPLTNGLGGAFISHTLYERNRIYITDEETGERKLLSDTLEIRDFSAWVPGGVSQGKRIINSGITRFEVQYFQ